MTHIFHVFSATMKACSFLQTNAQKLGFCIWNLIIDGRVLVSLPSPNSWLFRSLLLLEVFMQKIMAPVLWERADNDSPGFTAAEA